MKPKFLGDSYDIVKQSLLRWLAPMGPWSTHPMFTEKVSPGQADAFARLLGTRLLSREIFTRDVERGDYLAPARRCKEHVFLDPDTGIRLEPIRGTKAPLYVFGFELVSIARARPGHLTLVFDQSLARGRERQELQDKLSRFAAEGVYGVAYVSHACFVLVGEDSSILERALRTLKKESRLPASRFLERLTQNTAMQRAACGGR